MSLRSLYLKLRSLFLPLSKLFGKGSVSAKANVLEASKQFESTKTAKIVPFRRKTPLDEELEQIANSLEELDDLIEEYLKEQKIDRN